MKRQRINIELEHIFKYPLTVAVAAIGYGKTTAARDFLTFDDDKTDTIEDTQIEEEY